MKLSLLLLIPIFAGTAACGGSGTESQLPPMLEQAPQALSSAPDDSEILSKAYDPNYTVPTDFFIDDRARDTSRSYTVHHVLDSSKSYELCSNDLVIAQAWEQADNDARAVNGYYVASVENERYFEFIRELEYEQDVGNVNDLTSPGYSRVFKCDSANRDGVDRSLVDGYSGRLTADLVDSVVLKQFTEYLWQFRFFDVSRKVVINSLGSQGADGPTHTLVLAFVVNQGTDRCDRVDVVQWQFQADSVNHEVNREFEVIRSFEAEMSGGSPRFCD